MQENTTISIARFYNCNLGDKSGTLISDVLREHVNRRDHSMWALGLRAEEARNVDKQRLIHGSGITVLELGGNDIGDATASKISNILQRDQWMTILSFRDCKLTASGISELYNSLDDSVHLMALALDGNAEDKASDKLISKIESRLKENKIKKTLPLLLKKQITRLIESLGIYDSLDDVQLAIKVKYIEKKDFFVI